MRELQHGHFAVTADTVTTPARFAQQVCAQQYDLILAEYPNPDWRGPQPVELLHTTATDIPLVLLTRTIQPETLGEFIRKGVADCVETKGLARLVLTVHRLLGEKALRNQLHQAERALRHSDAQYCALLENPTYGMCRCSMDDKLLNANQALAKMLGYESKDELLAAGSITNIMPDLEDRALLFDYTRRTTRAEPIEIEWQKKDGTPLRVRLTCWIVRGDDGVPEGYEVIAEDVTERHAREAQLREEAETDPLTELANQRRLLKVLFAEIRRSERTGREFSVVLLDLDGLKRINDRHGHLTGSRALCRLADILRRCCRSIDTAARFGGDEFALVLPETGAPAARQVAQRICDRLASDGEHPRLSVSLGVAIYPQDGDTIETLLHHADGALYEMKSRHQESYRQ